MSDERHDDSEDLNRPPAFFPLDELGDLSEPEELNRTPIQVNVENVFVTKSGTEVQHYVLLSDGERRLPIVIGPYEAKMISTALNGQVPERPMPYDLMKTLMERLGGAVDRVLIDDIWSGTYYAKLVVAHGEEEFEVDSRPSDALALAVRFGAPILVAEYILDRQGD